MQLRELGKTHQSEDLSAISVSLKLRLADPVNPGGLLAASERKRMKIKKLIGLERKFIAKEEWNQEESRAINQEQYTKQYHACQITEVPSLMDGMNVI